MRGIVIAFLLQFAILGGVILAVKLAHAEPCASDTFRCGVHSGD